MTKRYKPDGNEMCYVKIYTLCHFRPGNIQVTSFHALLIRLGT